MTINELRFFLTNCEEINSVFNKSYMYSNYKLLISPSVEDNSLVAKLFDDIELLPEIPQTKDKQSIKFYTSDYNENVYSASELLAFLFASISEEWDIIKGKDCKTNKEHFYLKNGNYIYDPSLSILTTQELYSREYIELDRIENKSIENYLDKNNNLYRYYHQWLFALLFKNKNATFSYNLIKNFQHRFRENINKQYEITSENIEDLRESFKLDDFLTIRQVLTQKRAYELNSSNIQLHPSIDTSVLEDIEFSTSKITDIIGRKYPSIRKLSYFNNTLGNCHALSILYNLYDENSKLVQGGFTYKQYSEFFPQDPFIKFYQHSWIEKEEFVYDPALRIITPKDLYHLIFAKEDEYTKEDTKSILKRIGMNLTYFRDFLDRKQVGNNESLIYRFRPIDTPETYQQGINLIETIEERE